MFSAAILILCCITFPGSHCVSCDTLSSDRPVIINEKALLPDNPRTHFSRSVNDAPVDGEVLCLNPPRFRWRYHPEGNRGGLFTFVFQVAKEPSFENPVIDVTTPFNFYNTIAPFEGTGPFYWRVGYSKGCGSGTDDTGWEIPMIWSPARSFRLTCDALKWDRSMLAHPDFSTKPHPRIILSNENLTKLRALAETDAISRRYFEEIRKRADKALTEDWYVHFPATDRENATRAFHSMARDLSFVAFMHRMTGDEKYASVKQRALTLASYPIGGLSSPEPFGEGIEDTTHNAEFIALLYDWLYPVLTPSERRVFVRSLEWRIDHFVNDFAWKHKNDEYLQAYYGDAPVVHTYGSLSTIPLSHSFEGIWVTFPAALAIYEDSHVARECFHLCVNWMVGVGSAHGFDEGWNEGPGYGNSKLKWLTNSMLYLDSVFPEFEVGKNPWLRRMCEYFRRITPVGMKYAPWGHHSNDQSYYESGHISNFRRLAYLIQDGALLHNWREKVGPEGLSSHRIWTEFSLKAFYETPSDRIEDDPVGLFPLSGTVMAGTNAPSTSECYETSVGMIFQCRPLGAYSHTFACENSFHIYGYGEDLSYAAGTSGQEPHSFHSMSHNTVLIDGYGQSQTHPPETARVGFLRAFQRGDGYVYWAGDATNAYPGYPLVRPADWWPSHDLVYRFRALNYLKRFIRHVVFLRGKYFVIFDDLACDRPAQYSWLYHILPHEPIRFVKDGWTIDYTVGDVPVRIVHTANRDNLEFIDMRGPDGFKNPLNDEDYTNDLARVEVREKHQIAGHNLYISNKTKEKEFHFLSVIAPVKPGDSFPEITRLDDWTVNIDGDIVSFDPKTVHEARIVIDMAAIRGHQPLVKSCE